MYCRGCHYELRGLPAGECPECAARFDPDDPATFDAAGVDAAARVLVRLQFVSAALMLASPVLGHVMLLVARVSLGRWPSRSGADDPRTIAGLGVLYWVTTVALVFAPLGAAGTVALPIIAAATRRGVVFWRLVLIGLVGWAGFAVMLVDPAGTAAWIGD